MRHIATFCGNCNCGCPELHIDDAAAPERRVVITDDFGQRIQMSLDQLRDLVARRPQGRARRSAGPRRLTPSRPAAQVVGRLRS